jgi:hypothetical protein
MGIFLPAVLPFNRFKNEFGWRPDSNSFEFDAFKKSGIIPINYLRMPDSPSNDNPSHIP